MKNHYVRTDLDLDVGADAGRLDEALDDEAASVERREDLDAARSVLAVPTRAVHYRRAHLHYRAMAVALGALDDPIAVDSHRWRERLVEFEPEG